MKNITFAKYNGIEYPAGIKADGKIVLRSKNIKDVDLGFSEKVIGNNHIFVKYVTRDEIEKIYDKRITAVYRGYTFEVIEETEDMISIVTMVGDYQEWIRLGMKSIDNGVYQKWVTKGESEIKIVKENL